MSKQQTDEQTDERRIFRNDLASIRSSNRGVGLRKQATDKPPKKKQWEQNVWMLALKQVQGLNRVLVLSTGIFMDDE